MASFLFPLVALGVAVPPLPFDAAVLSEATTNIPFEVDFEAMSRIAFTLALDASPTNCVEVAIGTDANGDGALGLDEDDLSFGFDCGRWFGCAATADSQTEENAPTDGRIERTFVLKRPKMDAAWNLVRVARLNVAEVEISVLNFAPGNECFYRHKFGICETICCNVNPMGVPLRWEASDGGTVNSDGRYRCPSIPAVNTLKAICGDAEFIPNITVVEPDGIEARNPQCYPYKVSAGRAGWIGLKQEFYVKPLDVSFVGIAMEEVPSTAGRRSGYFARPGFDVIGCHSKAMGAGEWMPIDRDNKMGKYDVASISLELLRVNADGDLTDNPDFGWEDGWITWEVPFGWASAELADKDKNTPPLKVFDPQAGHRFEITPSGLVTVRKFGNSAQREADGRMYCNGIEWRKDE